MAWNKRTLALPATPPSVKLARRWVGDVLEEVGRPELVPSAQLGVSELVTNAILHAEPPVTVRVRGTVVHPRVEVSDQSLVPPEHPDDAEADGYLATFGRGLDLVASHAQQWGSDINFNNYGKTVWFEPSEEPHEPADVPSVVFDVNDALAALGADAIPESELVPIELLGMPPQAFAQLRHHFNEIGREARLLALAEPERWPAAAELSDLFVRAEHDRRQARGPEELSRAIAEGIESIDLHYLVAASAPVTMGRIAHALENIYASIGGDDLLAVAPEPVLLDLQRWYFAQFVRQGEGLPPERWNGPTRVRVEDWQIQVPTT